MFLTLTLSRIRLKSSFKNRKYCCISAEDRELKNGMVFDSGLPVFKKRLKKKVKKLIRSQSGCLICVKGDVITETFIPALKWL